MKNKHTSLYILFCFSLLISCGKSDPVNDTPKEEHHDEGENIVELSDAQFKTAALELSKVEQKQISGTIKVNGVLDVPPQQLISVSVPLGGFLKNTELLQGSRVKKGQLIATIENMDFIQMQQDYLEAKNQLELTKADYERQQELAKENVNAQKALQQAKSSFGSWQAKATGLREKLKMININMTSLDEGNITGSINIYSPINGYVTEVNVNIGKFINPSDVLFEIVDTNHLHAELTVFEKDILKLKIGQKVRFTLANETKERFATIYLIGREISNDRTVRIHCHIDKEDTQLLPGMYLKAIVETGGASVTAVPNEAVIDYQGKKYVFTIDSKEEAAHKFLMQEIQVGNSELGYTEILSLPEGFDPEKTEVVIKGAYSLLSKLKNSEEEGQTH